MAPIRLLLLIIFLVTVASESFARQVTFVSRDMFSFGSIARDGALGDVDNDGDLDYVVGHNDFLVWHEFDQNNGQYLQDRAVSKPAGASDYYGVSLADIDGDGDLDIFAEFDSRTGAPLVGIYYEYLGGADVFADELPSVEGSGTITDMDNDGDLDLVFALNDRSTLGWYENMDGLGNMGPFSTISTLMVGIKKIAAGDIDGDGYEDIAAAANNSDNIVWFRNQMGDLNSLSPFSSGNTITDTQDGPSDVSLGDIDGDGDLDVVTASEYDDTVAWYRNDDGLGSFGDRNEINVTANGAVVAALGDLDNDGDLDVVTSSRWDNTTGWHENLNGEGQFGLYQELQKNWGFLFVGDVDQDGDSDIVGAIGISAQNGWLENTTAGPTDTEAELAGDPSLQELTIYPNPATSTASLSFSLQHPTDVSVKAYDILGRTIDTVFDGFLSGGPQKMDIQAESYPRGILFIRVATHDESWTTKLILAK